MNRKTTCGWTGSEGKGERDGEWEAELGGGEGRERERKAGERVTENERSLIAVRSH